MRQGPSVASIRLDLGIALAEAGRHADALVEFETAAGIEPDSSRAHYNRGRALNDLGKTAASREALSRAIGLNARFVPALQLMASIEREAGNLQAATELLLAAVAEGDENPELHHDLANALNDAGMTDEAISRWETVLSLDPQHREALYNLAQALQDTDKDRSGEYLQRFAELKAEELKTDRAGTLWNFALEAAKHERWKQAFSLFKQALEVCGACPARGQIHKNLGLVYGHSGDYASAESELEKAADLLPQDREVSEALAIVRSNLEK